MPYAFLFIYILKFFFFFLKKKKKKPREKWTVIHSPNITMIYRSVNLFLGISLTIYIIPKIITDPLWSSKNLRKHKEGIFIIGNFGGITYKEEGKESFNELFDTSVHKD